MKLTILQEMEQERIAREAEEQEKNVRMAKIKDQFTNPEDQWEKDKADIQNLAAAEKAKEEVVAAHSTPAPTKRANAALA